MIRLSLVLFMCASQVLACDRPVCQSGTSGIAFLSRITFDDLPSGFGPGRAVNEVLAQPGAQFGERFAAQIRLEAAPFDLITGLPTAPLALMPGEVNQNLAVLSVWGNNMLNGQGPLGFPDEDASGEGSIAVLFDRDQAGFAFDLRGGESGEAEIVIFTRQGREIDRLILSPLGEENMQFLRQGEAPDMAGFVLMNRDPAGIAIDNLRFDGAMQTS